MACVFAPRGAVQEQAALAAESVARVVLLRTGVVLDPKGGALAQMLPPFKMFVGGPVGSGKQYMSWIHHEDECGLILHGLDDNMVHPQEAVDIDEKLRAAGVPVECHLYESTGHVAPVTALSFTLRMEATTLADVREFIDRTVAAGVGSKPVMNTPCNSVRDRKTWHWENPPRPHGPGADAT